MGKISKKFTEEQIKAINNYSNDIVTIYDLTEAIRQKPGESAGGLGDDGLLTLIREVYQNGLDQILENSWSTKLSVMYNESTREFACLDDGKGIPYNDMIRVVTEANTSKNYIKKKGGYSSGLHGTGLKVVGALSQTFRMVSYMYDGTAMELDLIDGHVKKKPYKVKNPGIQGTFIAFTPWVGLGEITLSWKRVFALIQDIASLMPIGTTIDFKGYDLNKNEHHIVINNKDGITTKLLQNIQFPICKPIIISDDTGEHKLDLAFGFDGGGQQGPDPNINCTAFCNFCPTIAGKHIDGTLNGIYTWFTKYMNNVFLAGQKKSKLKVTNADIRNGLVVMISAAALKPIFIGQAKQNLANLEMEPFCRNTVMNGLDQWSQSNPQDLTKLCKYFKDLAEIRTKSESNKSKAVAKYEMNVLTGLPAKFAKPTEKWEELFIVEGDSAFGTARNARDIRTQGLFPIRGKIPSAFEKSRAEFLANAEIDGIYRTMLKGKPYYKGFDPIKDVPWDKIVIMADADVDGEHIASLILRMMILYSPQIIEAGKLYKIYPPLYGIKNGKKVNYIINDIDFVKFVQKDFMKSNIIMNTNKRVLSNVELMKLFLINDEYVRELEDLAANFGVEPEMMEFALVNNFNKTAFGPLKKNLVKEFRFMKVEKNKIGGGLIYEGTINQSNFLPFNDRLIKASKKVMDIIIKNDTLSFILNGKNASLYNVMKAYESAIPAGISRYKGLGEMNADQLANILKPNSERTMIQYTLEDAKAEIQTIREYESDRSKLLELVGTVKRSELME